LSLAWLETALGADPAAWANSRAALHQSASSLGEVIARQAGTR